ncbi:helix-turn-helix domain-containing protein [Leifsonia sp. 2MCAF36]|uniref:helix-turn-helix domain-containing protein n=1 Tax=Leifsonia sp. 2MCAF36 TaxID=3232988 RepID=UPI003F9C97BC
MQYSLSWAASRPEEAIEALAPVYRNVDIRTDDEHRFGVSTLESGDPTVTLSSFDWTADGRGRSEANSFFTVGDVYAGSVTVTAGRETLDSSRLMLIPPRRLDASWTGSHSARTVRLERATIDAYARNHFGVSATGVRFTETRAISPVHEALWRAVERHAREEVAAHPDLLHNDLIWDETARHLVATLLTVFPNSTLEVAAPRDGAAALPASVRRAIAYMEEHVAEPVTIADIAAAARLSPRGIQDAFARIVGHSPMRHLRLLRLEAARNDLLLADPTNGHTVADIARRWGFPHVPRFAEAYRAQFGENPRVTLQR